MITIPKEIDLLEFISNNDFVNYSRIAEKFNISNLVVPELIRPLTSSKKIGRSKYIEILK